MDVSNSGYNYGYGHDPNFQARRKPTSTGWRIPIPTLPKLESLLPTLDRDRVQTQKRLTPPKTLSAEEQAKADDLAKAKEDTNNWWTPGL